MQDNIKPVAEVTKPLENRIEELDANIKAGIAFAYNLLGTRTTEKIEEEVKDTLDEQLRLLGGYIGRLKEELREQTDRAERVEHEATMKAGEFVEQLCMSEVAMRDWVVANLSSPQCSRLQLLLSLVNPAPDSYWKGIADAIRALAGRFPKPNLLPELYARIDYLEKKLAERLADERWYTNERQDRIWKFTTKDEGKVWFDVTNCGIGMASVEPETAPWHISITKAEADRIRKGWER